MAGQSIEGRFGSNPDFQRPQQDPYNVSGWLRPKAESLGFRLVTFNQTKSTMPTIDHMAISEPRYSAVLANHQTAGVGRDESKKWHDTPGASILLSGSVVMDEGAVYEFADLFPLGVALALQRRGAGGIGVKAPNDLVDWETGKKVGGVIVKNAYDENHQYAKTVFGIGVNVHYSNEDLASYPTDYGATSLDVMTGELNSRQDIVIDILEKAKNMATEATVISRGGESSRAYQNRLWMRNSYLLGKKVEVSDGDNVRQGIVVNAEIGRGITLGLPGRAEQIEIFDTDTKVRVIQ